MAATRQIYGEINSKTGMRRVFGEIRRDVQEARSRPALTELYKRAGYLVTLTHAPSWQEKFGADAIELRAVGEEEFRKTAHKINRRAVQIGTEADYDETWEPNDDDHHEAAPYRPTESKYKGGAKEMYVTYDLEQKTRSDGSALYPKVKRVYIAGDVKDWQIGEVRKKTGREVHGVRIEYEQSRAGYRRKPYEAERGDTSYTVGPASVGRTSQRFVQVVEVPETAREVQFHTDASSVPDRYRHALQDVR